MCSPIRFTLPETIHTQQKKHLFQIQKINTIHLEIKRKKTKQQNNKKKNRTTKSRPMFCTGRASEELGRSTEGLVEFGFQSVESWVSFLELRSFAVDRIKGCEDRDRDFFLFRHVLSCFLSNESDLTVVTKCVPSLASLLLNVYPPIFYLMVLDPLRKIVLIEYLWI